MNAPVKPLRPGRDRPSQPRLLRELATIEAMTQIYCADHHNSSNPCGDCRALIDYAAKRLAVCPFGDEKPVCAKCQIHCYGKTMREKVRDVGIYKTVGMTPGQVMAMVGTTAGLLGLVSAVVGIPVGLLLTTGLMDLLTASYGFGRVDVTLNALYLGLLVPAISLVSMAGSLLPGRWAAGCSIVHVLRSE